MLGGDDARVEVCRLLKAGGATLMTSKNTLDDGVRLFSCDTTNTRYRRYAALDRLQRPDIMCSRCRTCVPRDCAASRVPAATSHTASLHALCLNRDQSFFS